MSNQVQWRDPKSRLGVRVLLVRHGESIANIDDVVAGEATCRGLTPRGHEQAGAVADQLAAEYTGAITALYSTPLARTLQTAAPIGQALALPIQPSQPAPIYGAAEGQRWIPLLSSHNPPIALTPDRPIAPGAEVWARWVARVGASLEVIAQRHPSETVVLVCHRETISATEQYLYRAPYTLAHVIAHAANASVTEWQRRGIKRNEAGHPGVWWRWERLRHNDTRHLSGSLEAPASPRRNCR